MLALYLLAVVKASQHDATKIFILQDGISSYWNNIYQSLFVYLCCSLISDSLENKIRSFAQRYLTDT